jgi:hypothetical protein
LSHANVLQLALTASEQEAISDANLDLKGVSKQKSDEELIQEILQEVKQRMNAK